LPKEELTIPRLVKDRDTVVKDGPVRLIDADNEQLGIVPIADARERAESQRLDLVLVSETSDPPVCRIMNFGKFQYEKKRQMKDQRKKQVAQKNKEIKFHANIDTHDYEIKVNHIRQFLSKGSRVKVSLFFRGRENAHKDKGIDLMNQIIEDLGETAHVDAPPRIAGKNLSMHLIPGPGLSK
jgi:translation initiation factor IF-3